MVPLLVATGATPLQAVGTSLLGILVSSLSGSWQNWRTGLLDPKLLLFLAVPASLTSYLGVQLANLFSSAQLAWGFALYLLVVPQLLRLKNQQITGITQIPFTPYTQAGIVFTGGVSGVLAGLFGIGGGAVMVPLQVLILNLAVKLAVVTSLAAIVPTALVALVAHALNGNVLWMEGLILSVGGLVGAQGGTRLLPKLSDQLIQNLFMGLLTLLSGYMFYKGYLLSLDPS